MNRRVHILHGFESQFPSILRVLTNWVFVVWNLFEVNENKYVVVSPTWKVYLDGRVDEKMFFQKLFLDTSC